MVGLSMAGVPSGFTSCGESVVRKPAVAGPKPDADDVHVHRLALDCRLAHAG